MSTLPPENQDFLQELYRVTEGDPENQVSMYDIGTTLGLDKDTAFTIAQDLIIDEMAELKSLSGGIGITAKGLAELNVAAPGDSAAEKTVPLSDGPVLNEEDRERVEGFITTLKQESTDSGTTVSQLEEIIFDLKTLEVQLLSPQPKTAIVKMILTVLAPSLEKAGLPQLAQTANNLSQ